MIIKYKHEGNWGFVDGLNNVTYSDFDQGEAVKKCRAEIETGERDEHNQEEFDTNIKIHNDVFQMGCEAIDGKLEGDGYNRQRFALISLDKLPTQESDYQAIVVMGLFKDKDDYDAIGLVCNDEVYLLNDQGVTIERLN